MARPSVLARLWGWRGGSEPLNSHSILKHTPSREHGRRPAIIPSSLPVDITIKRGQVRHDDDDDDGKEDFNPYLFIKCLPPYRRALPPGWSSRPKALPPRPRGPAAARVPPLCLVLDLDETLVHCTVEPTPDADLTFPVEFNGTAYQVHVRCRPFLQEFLEAVAGRFEVVIFTASQQVYADKLLDKIDPSECPARSSVGGAPSTPLAHLARRARVARGAFSHRSRKVHPPPPVPRLLPPRRGQLPQGPHRPRPRPLPHSPRRQQPHAFGYQVDNGIPIESWFDDPYDKELLKLEAFLRTPHGLDDVRTAVRATFQTQRLVRDA